jgi:lambda family phage portal protein
MDTLTRWISFLSPGWAASRLQGQARLAYAQRYFEAADLSSKRPRRGSAASADAVNDRARQHLREFARWLDENHDLAVGVLDDLVTNIVGEGAGVEPTAVFEKTREPATDFNNQLRDLWQGFWEFPEVTGELPGPEVERLVVRSTLRDGEVFIQHQTKASAPFGSKVPYALELLEADFVPYFMIDSTKRVIHGVQKDGWGKPVGYHVYKTHPGSIVYPVPTLETVYILALNMLHVKLVRRLHQTRGVSIFHAVLGRLDDLKDYEESERIAARIAASLTAFIRRDIAMADNFTTTDDGVTKSYEMKQGMIFDGLMPGEDIGLIDSKRPNPNLNDFRNSQVRAIASGTGTRFSSIAKDYNGTYSAQRQELVEAVMHYRRLFDYFRSTFYIPIWRRMVDSARLAGLLKIPKGISEVSVYRPEIRPPRMPWIDPLKEINAYEKMVLAGFQSRQQVVRDLGGDPATVDAQLKSDWFIPGPKEVFITQHADEYKNEDKPDQNQPAEDQPDEDKPDEDKPDEDKPDEDKPDQVEQTKSSAAVKR